MAAGLCNLAAHRKEGDRISGRAIGDSRKCVHTKSGGNSPLLWCEPDCPRSSVWAAAGGNRLDSSLSAGVGWCSLTERSPVISQPRNYPDAKERKQIQAGCVEKSAHVRTDRASETIETISGSRTNTIDTHTHNNSVRNWSFRAQLTERENK